uniref:(northern house mosquito) hypothetical protein n=1 Tax=Culex pipiens TaxID=7175 RepID=A0A8D8CBW2_CULPI
MHGRDNRYRDVTCYSSSRSLVSLPEMLTAGMVFRCFAFGHHRSAAPDANVPRQRIVVLSGEAEFSATAVDRPRGEFLIRTAAGTRSENVEECTEDAFSRPDQTKES